jgi:hypothetical protein
VIKKASAGGKSVMVISNVDANGDLTDKALENKLKEAGFNKSDYVVYSPDDFSDYAVQGAEADYVIVDRMPSRTDNPYLDLITFYTYLSRSLVGSLIKGGDYKSNLKLHNTAFTYTSDYSLPGLDQQEKLKDEKVKIIEKIIGDYEPPKSVVSEKSSEAKIKADTSISLGDDVERTAESPITEDEKKEYQNLIAEREDRVRNGDTGEDLGNAISKSNFEGKVDYVFGWGFYNHSGTIRDNYGNHYSIATGKNLDMDGLFGPEKRMLSPNVVRGFVMFKNLLALHHNDPTKLISGLNNPDILDFFIAAYPKITSSEELVNKRKDAYNWLIDHLKVDADTYAFAYKYNSKTDTTVMTIDGTDAQSNGSTFITYGKRIYCQDEDGNMIFNQYITLGAMPSNHTLKAYSVDDVAFKAL